MEEHGGSVALLDAEASEGRRGALVRLAFPREPAETAATDAAPDENMETV
jgi:hypothetical protein